MYTALYRAERPEVFSEILGQEHIVKILKNQIAENMVSHAYLFCGTRGTGKTTTARILAKALNCTCETGDKIPCGVCENCKAIKDGTFMDVIEIDAASNNGVDNIRELRESVKYPPSVGKKKIYIIDEVHMLSTGAFNALLKTLEEPPENVIFILATTEPHKLPATILSRCMRLDFKRVSTDIIASGMNKICQARGVNISEGALRLLANGADGSVRDGLSLLEQILASGEKNIDRDLVLEYLGTLGEDFFIELTDLVSLKKVSEALVLINEVLSDGRDAKQVMKDWVSHYRNLLLVKFLKKPEDILNMSWENIEKIRTQSQHTPLEEIDKAIILLSKTINDARWSTQPRVLLELAMVNLATGLLIEKNVKPGIDSSAIQTQVRSSSSLTKSVAEISKVSPEVSKKENSSDALEKPLDRVAHKVVVTEESQGAEKEPGGVDFEAGSPVESMDSYYSQDALRELWDNVLEEGKYLSGSINIVADKSHLVGLKPDAFTVETDNYMFKAILEQNRETLEDLMSKTLGRKLKMVCLDGSGSPRVPIKESPKELPSDKPKVIEKTEIELPKVEEGSEDPTDIVLEASEILGIKIELE